MPRSICFAILLIGFAWSARAVTFEAADFGVVPGSDRDCTAALQKAADEAARHPGATLRLAPGTYHFHTRDARQRLDYQSNTAPVPARRYALLIENARRLTVDGQGATLMMHGEMSAVGMVNSENVTLKNVNIDWDCLPTSQATVVEQGSDWQMVTLEAKQFPYIVSAGQLQMLMEGVPSRVWSTMEYDPVTGRNLGDGGGISHAEELAPGRLKIWGARHVEKTGNVLALRHHNRTHAGIYVLDSRRVRIENTELWATFGLGILFQKTADPVLDHVSVRARPGAGLFVGPKDDGFHFSGCSGKILIDHCRVEDTPDDPVNIHGTYLPVDEQPAPDTVHAHFGEGWSIGQSDWGHSGDSVTVIDRRTLLPVERNIIKAFRLLDPKHPEVIFAHRFQHAITHDMALENLADTPDAVIRHSWFGNNRARGILCSTPGHVLIEDNTFAIQGSAILIPGDANGWFESGAVADVTIRHNTFDNCLIGPTQFTDGIISIWPNTDQDVPGNYYHRHIRIEDNTFKLFDRPILYAHSVDGLVFSGNTLVKTDFRPPWHPVHDALTLRHCREVRIEDNHAAGRLLSDDIVHPDTLVGEIHLDGHPLFKLER